MRSKSVSATLDVSHPCITLGILQMATSFRFSAEEMKRLEYLSKKTGKSKAQIVKQAIDSLYEREIQKAKRSLLDCLTEGGFQPTDLDWGDLSTNKDLQRQIIRERLAKKNSA